MGKSPELTAVPEVGRLEAAGTLSVAPELWAVPELQMHTEAKLSDKRGTVGVRQLGLTVTIT